MDREGYFVIFSKLMKEILENWESNNSLTWGPSKGSWSMDQFVSYFEFHQYDLISIAQDTNYSTSKLLSKMNYTFFNNEMTGDSLTETFYKKRNQFLNLLLYKRTIESGLGKLSPQSFQELTQAFVVHHSDNKNESIGVDTKLKVKHGLINTKEDSPADFLLSFIRGVFKNVKKQDFNVEQYHIDICNALERVYLGKLKRLMINLPPRYGKTEIAIISFIAWSLGKRPSSKFLHISYGDKLATDNGYEIRNRIDTDYYREVFPKIKLTNRADSVLKTDQGGVVRTAGSEGSVTGFGAGGAPPSEVFGGGLFIDDPHKPEEAASKLNRERVVQVYESTLSSRLNDPQNTPIVIIAQRTHANDLCGYLQKKEKNWEVISYPAISETGVLLSNRMYTKENLKTMENNKYYVFQAQYQQNPVPAGGLKFKDEWFRFYDRSIQIPFESQIITGDTALTTKETSSYTVFQCWGLFEKKAYLVDQMRGKWKPVQLSEVFCRFYEKYNSIHPKISRVYIEVQAAGYSLISDLQSKLSLPIQGVVRKRDKVWRVNDILPFFQQGLVYIPQETGEKAWEGLNDYLYELKSFSDNNDHDHDDQVDATCDGIEFLLKDKLQGGFKFACF